MVKKMRCNLKSGPSANCSLARPVTTNALGWDFSFLCMQEVVLDGIKRRVCKMAQIWAPLGLVRGGLEAIALQ